MIDARHYAREETLANGVRVTIRAVRPDDRDRIANAFRGLERESMYTRFFAFRSELSEAELGSIAAIDFKSTVMLVATVRGPDDEIVIAGGRYVAGDGRDGKREAEVAFTVEEDYQGLGIAGRLLHHLAAIARDRGIVRLTAEVLPDNKAMLVVFTKSGLALDRRHDDGVVHLTLTLP
jgi:GNAT superfamily N-acetyltransferase